MIDFPMTSGYKLLVSEVTNQFPEDVPIMTSSIQLRLISQRAFQTYHI